MTISDDFFDRYRNGSRPNGNADADELALVKTLLQATLEQTQTDFNNNRFVRFTPYQTQTGFYLGTFQDALVFNNYHEGIHLGMMMTIKKFV